MEIVTQKEEKHVDSEPLPIPTSLQTKREQSCKINLIANFPSTSADDIVREFCVLSL